MLLASQPVADNWESTMALDFDANRVIYDDERDIIVFMAMDGPRLIRCSISRDALRSMARRRAESAREMLEAYRTYADDIHRVAAHKYRLQQLDVDGSVLV